MFQRILSLAPSNTEILFALGVQDRIVGVTTFCDYPEEAKSLTKVGSWIHVTDMKQFDELKPDLILCSMYVPPAVQEWADTHAVQLVNLYPQTLEQVYESFLMIGELVEKQEEAKKLVAEMREKLDRIAEEGKKFQKVRVYSEEFHKPPTVAANWVPDLIKIAGGIPMAEHGKLSYEVSGKEVAEFDPDLIVLHWCGCGLNQKTDDVKNREDWKEMKAVKEDKFAIVDDSFLNRPGPRLWNGAELIQEAIEKMTNS